MTRSGRLRSGPRRRLADAGSIPQTGIELASFVMHSADDLGRAELVELQAAKAGVPTFPQQCEAVVRR
ncbi:MAG TPA: hypothetical protein PK667_00805 [Nitrosomonas europaea]|uniref:hypothetical protein n=1 Tax=Nitrosomonas europaea TaxID=915 RepID=UPI002C19F7AD|nr:hypothetical protein [Nitrosomonas europaea]HUM72718.1 hypothetical protein [Nitrosomonas europaea]